MSEPHASESRPGRPPPEQCERVVRFLQDLAGWAAAEPAVVALALVGSWARGAAHRDSDVDVVVIAREPRPAAEPWLPWLRDAAVLERAQLGPLEQIRVVVGSGVEVELGLTTPAWAAADPVDAGTARVAGDGLVALHDPDGLLGRLLAALGAPEPEAPPAAGRPFYGSFGWAYDRLVADPVAPWVAAVAAALRGRRGVELLDAGCGTGRHAAALARAGHRVTLLDAAPALLWQARTRVPGAPAIGDDLLRAPLAPRFDAIACRGVLNDLLEDDARTAAVRALAATLRPGGVAVLDVRERDASHRRYARPVAHERTAATPAGLLRYTSRGRSDGELLRFEERHELEGSARVTAESELAMRPWGAEELAAALAGAGFREIEIGPGAGRSAGDRLLAVAVRGAPRPGRA